MPQPSLPLSVTQNYFLRPAQIWVFPPTGGLATETPETRRQTRAVPQKQRGHGMSVWERVQGQPKLSQLNETSGSECEEQVNQHDGLFAGCEPRDGGCPHTVGLRPAVPF